MVKSLEEANRLIREAVTARLAAKAKAAEAPGPLLLAHDPTATLESVSKPMPEKLSAEVSTRLCVVGLAGNIGSGKSEAARMIPGAHHLQWADPIYRAIAAMLEVDEAVLRDRATKEEPLPVWGINVVPRMLARTLGTEWGRETVHPDLWVNVTLRTIDRVWRSTGATVFAVCGTRFVNEVDAIRSLGGEVWWVSRPGTTTGSHVSDTVLTAGDCDRVIVNNGTLDRLRHNVEAAFADYVKSTEVAA